MRARFKRAASKGWRGPAPRPCAAALALWLGLGALVSACAGEPAPPGPAPSPLIYEIAGPHGETQGWLLGTIHALPEGTQWRTPGIEAAIAQADCLILEVAAPGDPAAREAFMALSASAGLPPLQDRIAPEWREPLGELAGAAGTDLAAFEATETWAAALILAQAMRTGERAHGAERALIEEFAGREIRELEGARAQLAIFSSLAEEDQAALLTSVIADFGDGIDQAGELRAAWLSGDAARLEAATREGMLADPELREAILLARNRAWATKLRVALEQQERPLIAVGAAHLVGPEGLAALLEAEGFALRPLN